MTEESQFPFENEIEEYNKRKYTPEEQKERDKQFIQYLKDKYNDKNLFRKKKTSKPKSLRKIKVVKKCKCK